MKFVVMTAAIGTILVLSDIGISRWSAEERVAAIVPTVDVDRQFAIKFCYRQYTNQTDVNHCLLRNAHLVPGRTR